MLCQHCKKNQASKSYEQVKQGKTQTAYYCLNCYHKLFLGNETGAESSLTVCPYCETSLTDFKKRNLVGCAYCYTALAGEVLPAVKKWQGNAAHTGKTPYESERTAKQNRIRELETVVEKWQEEDNYAYAEAYERQLARLDDGLEEEYVWQKRPRLSKR